jgi:hypothetical protein
LKGSALLQFEPKQLGQASKADSVDRQFVASSMIRSVGYDPRSQTLEIEFHHQRVYQYFDVPEFLYKGLLATSSKGEYFMKRISGRFRYESV